jgi:hypothetical protein
MLFAIRKLPKKVAGVKNDSGASKGHFKILLIGSKILTP